MVELEDLSEHQIRLMLPFLLVDAGPRFAGDVQSWVSGVGGDRCRRGVMG